MNSSFPSDGRRFPRPRPRIGLAAALAGAILLSSCGSANKAAALESQADAATAGGNPRGAAKLLGQATALDGNNSILWLKLGRASRDIGDPQGAVDAFQQSLDLDPGNVEAMQNLVILYVASRHYDEAKRILDPLMTLAPGDVAGTFAKGAIAYYEQRYADAGRIADDMIKAAPSIKDGYTLKAHVLEKTGGRQQAISLLEDRLKAMPDSVEMAEQVLDLYRATGNVEGVRSISLRLAQLKPGDPRYQLESLRAYQARGDTAAREQATTALIQRYRHMPSVMVSLADFWISILPRAEALRRINEVAAGTDQITRAGLVGRLVGAGDTNDALNLLQGVAGQPVSSANVDMQAMLANLLSAQGKTEPARVQAQRVLDFDGTNEIALLVRARAFMAARDYAKAMTDAQLIISNDPANEAASLLIADAYAGQGNDALATAAFGDAQSRSPHSMTVLRRRTDWLIGKGRTTEAAQIAGLFARSNNSDDSWAFYAGICRKANDPICLAQAQARGSVL